MKEKGITDFNSLRITPRGSLLATPLKQSKNEHVCYGLGSPVQISPTKVMVFLNRRICETTVPDFEAGSDAIIFDDWNSISVDHSIPISRNESGTHPRTGKPVILAKYPISAGFVPLAARLPDGSPHPYAGSGFGLASVRRFPADLQDVWADNTDIAPCLELQQFEYNGCCLEVTRTELFEPDELIKDWSVSHGALHCAIPDGKSLVMGLSAYKSGQRLSCGLSRWQRGENGWRPTEFVPVTEPDGSTEPSIIRDIDNSLLLCARNEGSTAFFRPFRVWRSLDGGISWALIINIPEVQMQSPLSLSNTLEGWPFIASNPRRDILDDSRGRMVMPLWLREDLCLWPLTKDRKGIEKSVNVFDARACFGTAPDTGNWFVNFWFADHPNGGVFRLADGCHHSLLFFRTMLLAEPAAGCSPTEHTGCRVAEIISDEKNEVHTWIF